MRATLLGHATYVVEGGGSVIYVDPVFFEGFEGTCVPCPQRVVHRDKLPRAQAVFLSHAHHDHFDKKTLETIPRSTPIYVPQDDDLLEELHRFGFYKLHAIAPYEPVSIGGLHVLATRSRDPREIGFLWIDESAVFWDQVDTVVDQRTCLEVAHVLNGRALDVAICTYMPLIEYAEAWVTESSFPRQRYDRLLETALMSGARTVIPGSSGERHVGKREWLNHRIFPATREKFLQDLRDIAPDQGSLLANPGDSIVVENGQAARLEKSPYADVIEQDTYRIKFDPDSSEPPPLVDENVNGYSEEHIEEQLSAIIGVVLPRAMSAQMTPDASGPLRTAWNRRAHLQIEAVTPSRTLSWHIGSWQPLTWIKGAEPKPDYVFRYVASDLVAYAEGKAKRIPTARYERHVHTPQPGEPYRLYAVDPARLNGVDLYYTVDEQYWWSPLQALK
jgi:hypothetical protein